MVSRALGTAIVILLLLASLSPIAGASDGWRTIDGASYEGAAVIEDGNPVLLWQSESHAVNVTLSSANSSEIVDICVGVKFEERDSTRELDCRSTRLSNETKKTLVIPFEKWPENEMLGEQTVVITARNAFNKEKVYDRYTVPVQVLQKDGDADNDRLINEEEVSNGTAPLNSDTDGDGLRDGEEVNNYETNPNSADTDGDSLRDGEEISRGTNPNSADTDDDRLTDGGEISRGTNPDSADTDGDGLTDGGEVNQSGTNPKKADTDGDGLTDGEEVNEHGTDPKKADTDGDGLTDGEEVNEHGTDQDIVDTDGDGLTDGEEVNEHGTDPKKADTDGDFVSDEAEVTLRTNPRGVVTPLTYILGGLVAITGTVHLGRQIDGIDSLARYVPVDGTGSDGNTDLEPPAETEPTVAMTPARTATPEPLITDEHRVLQLLDRNGGRVQQGLIVEETEWSKSKVSRLLSKMENNDQIKKITIGRENLITHPSDLPLDSGERNPSDD